MTRILIIEDEDEIRLTLKRILELSGFDVLGVPNGLEGVAIAKQSPPDLILCDVMMPMISGYKVLETLKKNIKTATIPFIFLTAKSDLPDIREGMNLGADDYLTKPVKTKDLLACIRMRLKKKDLHRQKSEAKLTTLSTNIARSMPHELNTPLNGIIGLASILNTMPDPEVKELSDGILVSSKRLHSTISKFLVYTELELTRCSPQESSVLGSPRTLSISQVVKRTAERIAAKAERMDDLQLKMQPGDISMSSFFFEKLMEELIDNAFKFSRCGTSVIIGNYHEKEQMILTIQDHGRGMQPDQVAEVAAYTQFERKIYEQQGMGLGLVIAKYIAELQGGTLTINSQPQVGTTVRVELPSQPV